MFAEYFRMFWGVPSGPVDFLGLKDLNVLLISCFSALGK